MRYEQIIPLTLTEQQDLMEVKMSPSALKKFIASPEARGILAGFEAEMIFSGLAREPDYESEEDFSEDRRARSISDVADFFRHDGHNTSGEIRALEQWLTEQYEQWLSKELDEKWQSEGEDWFSEWFRSEHPQDFKLENKIQAAQDLMLDDDYTEQEVAAAATAYETRRGEATEQEQQQIERFIEYLDQVNDMLDDEIQDAWRSRGREYSTAYEQWIEEESENHEQSDWFDSRGEYMTDIWRWYNNESSGNITWPYWEDVYDEDESGYDYDTADDLAQNLSRAVGMRAQANRGYHQSRPDNTWVIEPDGSLSGDSEGDMPAEIISPPMPVAECLEKLRAFMSWAKANDAYTNESTGFHVGVSLPNQGGDIDYIKLALFLGDRYVLETFGRIGNHFTESAIKIITDKIEDGSADVESAMTAMRNNLLQLAQKSIREHRTEKYESINIKDDYIEFRSMGGQDYEQDVGRLTDMISRYAYAMYIAGDDTLERQEYAKKLYKLLSGNQDNDVIRLFSEFNAGEISKQQLKIKWIESMHRNMQRSTAAARQTSQVRAQAAGRIYDTLPKHFYRLSQSYYFRHNDPIAQGVSPDDAYARAVKADASLAKSRRDRHITEVFPFMVTYLGPDDSEFGSWYPRSDYDREYSLLQNWPARAVWARDADNARDVYKATTDMPYKIQRYGKFDVQQLAEPTAEQMAELATARQS